MEDIQKQQAAAQSRASEMVIGKTIYIVTTSFAESATETVEQKLVRYVADRISSDVNKSDMGLVAVNK